jgi:hypothetical protein
MCLIILGVFAGNGMEWGGWMGSKNCNDDIAVTGISVKIDKKGGDDTSLNDVQLLCGDHP